jgi:hypothetical protein
VRNIFTELVEKQHDEDFCPVVASAPTAAPPGSFAKLEVMAARVEAGQSLWHDEDVNAFFSRHTANPSSGFLSRDVGICVIGSRGKILS